MGFPGGSGGKEPANAGDARDVGSIPGLGRSPGIGNGNPLQYSCLQNLMERGAWRATVHGVEKSQLQLSTDRERQDHGSPSAREGGGALVGLQAPPN